jgi:hypothetical protein
VCRRWQRAKAEPCAQYAMRTVPANVYRHSYRPVICARVVDYSGTVPTWNTCTVTKPGKTLGHRDDLGWPNASQSVA